MAIGAVESPSPPASPHPGLADLPFSCGGFVRTTVVFDLIRRTTPLAPSHADCGGRNSNTELILNLCLKTCHREIFLLEGEYVAIVDRFVEAMECCLF
jgi:hypothetical protein